MTFSNRQPRNTRPVMKTSKYLPGQRLNTAADVADALIDAGQKLVGSWFDQSGYSGYFYFDGKEIVYSKPPELEGAYGDNSFVFSFTCGEYWSIYTEPAKATTPPKRKVVSTRWFAVFEDSACLDKVVWRGPYLCEVDVKEDYPNALAYHCATVEIEIDGSISVEVDDET